MDSAPSHPKDQTDYNIKVHFFPANTNYMLQPHDQGIIKCLKSYSWKQSSPKSTSIKKLVRLQKG